jgi:hypothetical protein
MNALRKTNKVYLQLYSLVFWLVYQLGAGMRIPYHYFQLLDPVQLGNGLWQSLWYLHAQPLTRTGGGLFAWISQYGKYLGYIAGFAMIIWTRKRPLLYALLLTILIMFATVPNLGLQGLSWVIAPALILGLYNSLGWYIAAATLHMLISYWGIHLTRGFDLFLTSEQANLVIQLSSLFAWGVIVVWCVQEIWQKSLLPRLFSNWEMAQSPKLPIS